MTPAPVDANSWETRRIHRDPQHGKWQGSLRILTSITARREHLWKVVRIPGDAKRVQMNPDESWFILRAVAYWAVHCRLWRRSRCGVHGGEMTAGRWNGTCRRGTVPMTPGSRNHRGRASGSAAAPPPAADWGPSGPARHCGGYHCSELRRLFYRKPLRLRSPQWRWRPYPKLPFWTLRQCRKPEEVNRWTWPEQPFCCHSASLMS